MKDMDMVNKASGNKVYQPGGIGAGSEAKAVDPSALPEDMLTGVAGGLRSMDWRTCKACGYNGGSFMYTDNNRNVKCPQCGAKQPAW